MIRECFHQTLWLTMQYFNSMWNFIFFTDLFLHVAFNTLLRLNHAFKAKNFFKNMPLFLLLYGFFGTVTKTLMTALIKPPDSNTVSDDFHSPPRSKSNIDPTSKLPKGDRYKPNFESKILILKNKDTMQRSSPNKSPYSLSFSAISFFSSPQSLDSKSPSS